MAINKVVYRGTTLFDITGDTVTSEALAEGVTAFSSSGALITGTGSGFTSSSAGGTQIPGINKIVFGGRTLVDLSVVTVTPETLLEGKTAHSANGALIVGTAAEKRILTLDESTWEEISYASENGLASSMWAVGDRKKITLNGTVGTLALSNYETYVYIIGFDHNGATNTIDFGTFKTTASGGKDVALIDSAYGTSKTDGTKYFNMNHSSNTNAGGWKGCDLRYDILGSTHAKGENANATTIANPVADTLMAALPSELRAVLKPMTIYTDNVADFTNDVASNVTSTVDYLPLLAEWEIFGAKTYANAAEQNYQAQYAYFLAGNSKRKYRHSATSSTANWWVRSPRNDNPSAFCCVQTSGTAFANAARLSDSLAPIFRV